MKQIIILILLLTFISVTWAQGNKSSFIKKIQNNRFQPGAVWNDTDGERINAHEGGILYNKGLYYWLEKKEEKQNRRE